MTSDRELLIKLLKAGEDYLAEVARHINPNGDGIAPDAGRRATARADLINAVVDLIEVIDRNHP